MNRLIHVLIGLFLSGFLVATPLEVTVREGTLIGEKNGEIAVFKGIAFATPPTGVRRWKAPEPPAHWSGKRLATAFSPVCSQQPYAEGSMFTRPSAPNSEDCLYLNVWTPNVAPAPEKPAAVMVWIHGGGLTRGTGSTSFYDGTALAKKGVVLVTINYRLGPFGYLAHPELSKESQNKSSGNYGTLDQIAALKWVQSNIAQFGGDADNITIFGESAGSWSVNHLAASPLAKGLFHKGIGESGGKFDPMPMLAKTDHELPGAEQIGLKFAKHVGADNLNDMRSLTSAAVVEGFASFKTQGLSQPNVDGWVFPTSIAEIYQAGQQNDVALILGSNADEGTNLIPPPKNETSARQFFQQMGGEHAALLTEIYEFDKDYASATYAMFRDGVFTWNMSEWARLSSDKNKNTWLYYFTFVPPAPMDGKLGAYHAAEIRYVFDNANMTFDGSEATETEHQVAAIMSDYWVNFAKYGKPESELGPAWPGFSRMNPVYMNLSDKPKMERKLLEKELAAIGKVMETRWAK